MKTTVKKLLSALLCLVMLVGVLPVIGVSAATSITMTTFSSRLADYKQNVYENGSTYVANNDGGSQCFGYANNMAKYILGSYPTSSMTATSSVSSNWKISYGTSALNDLHVGDIVRFKYGNATDHMQSHSIFVTSISENTINFSDANFPRSDGKKNIVRHDASISKSDLIKYIAQYLDYEDSKGNYETLDYTGWVAHYKGWDDVGNDTTPITYKQGFYKYDVSKKDSNSYLCSAPYAANKITSMPLTADKVYEVVGYTTNSYEHIWYKTSDGYWVWSGYMYEITLPPPSKPTGLTGTRSGSANVQLKWNAVSGATKYEAQYSRSGVNWTTLDESPVTTNSLLAKGFSWNYDYVDFRVRAVNSGGASDWVQVRVNKTTGSAPTETTPSAPTGLTGTRSGSANVQLKWDAVSGATRYEAQYSRSGVSWTTLDESPVTTNSLLAKNFSWNYDYVDFRVRAVNSVGVSDWVQVRVNKTTSAADTTVAVTSVSISKLSLSMEPGDNVTLTATVNPYNASDKTVTWSSSNTSVATVSNGTVTAVKPGTATITASAGGKSASCAVTVTEKNTANTTIPVTSVSVSRLSLSLEIGDSATLTATVNPYNASNKTVTWSSSDSNIATVNNGTVTGVKAGTAIITATAEGKTGSCTVTVAEKVVAATSLTLNKSTLSLATGESETLTASVAPSNATNKTVTWTSSNVSVATVSNGKVSAVSAGTATITSICGTVTASCTVMVTEKQTAPKITTEVIASASVGTSYRIRLTASGTTPITWSVSSGSLPDDISLDASSGAISGTPTKAGSFSFTISAKNNIGESTKGYTMTVTETSVTLRFETNDGSAVESKTFGKGGIVDLSDYTTARDGYVFTGWYKDAALTELVTQITVNEDMTVYAGWVQEQAAETPTSDIGVTVNGVAVIWTNAAPFIDENDRTMVPLRAVADALGLLVDWNPIAREAIFTNGTMIIYFPIGSNTARTSGGGSVTMDTAAVIVNDRTYAPIRYLAEFFSHSVDWDGANRTVIIE